VNKWTEEQQKVIELHDRNILVSAAAGSGKTAVLVERIIQMITRAENPVDIDRLVIVTFTNMAAYEMRMRIMAAIEKKIAEEPDNQHLSRQLALVHSAKITTIDSFCLDIVKSYFNEAGLDPAFRVADEGELKLLSADVMKEMLEDYYASENEDFYRFVDCFAPQKTDEKIENYILKLYRFSQSYPWPQEWLLDCMKAYQCKNVNEFMQCGAMQYLYEYIRKMITSVKEDIKLALEICEDAAGPYMYRDTILAEWEMITSLDKIEGFDAIRQEVNSVQFGRLPAKRDAGVDTELKETVKGIRDGYKKIFDKLKKDIYDQTCQCAGQVQMLITLTLDYMQRMDEKKREKKIINFNDMEHIALNILIEKADGKYVYRNAADELAKRYDEILIDEYQDSNMVQELILRSVSRERSGKNNIFMVGDVKQSIYKFRLARPELFIQKYNTYGTEDGPCQKIELHKNFRSRETVLDSVNDVFQKTMSSCLGGVEYDTNAMLYAGAVFPEQNFEVKKTEVLLLEHEEDNEYSDAEAEAVMVADKIIRMLNGEDGRLVLDKESGSYRTPRAGDIVILLRSLKGWADTFVEILGSKGIAAYSESATGYFATVEIQTLLAMLAVIDNPRQDIALATVMKSYFGGFDNDELAAVRSVNINLSLYDAFINSSLEKAEKLRSLLQEYRQYSRYMEISHLIWKLAYDTGFYDYIGSMPAGTIRQDNVSMLVEKARQYEKTSYKGLFHFLRYIEKLKTYEVDFAGASESGEDSSLVKIMSIHKSKGLEFPIVILAGAARGFNTMDARDGIIMEPDFGIGMDDVDIERHVKKPTVMKKTIARKIVLDNLAEEQRILYVAMTRAKEYLLVTGSVADSQKAMEKWSRVMRKEYASYSDLTEQKCYLDMVMPAALDSEKQHFLVEITGTEEFERMKETTLITEKKETAVENIQEKSVEFSYPHPIYDIPVKMSVSEIKHMGMEQDQEGAAILPKQQEEEEIIPEFLKEEVTVQPAAKGSAYHALMQWLDYDCCADEQMIHKQMEDLCQAGKLSQEWKKVISARDIMEFVNSPLGGEAHRAFCQKKLHREKQFMTGIPANEIFRDTQTQELVIVQGVIDMYYETDEGIVLVDYKTDKVPYGKAGEDELIRRYREQLWQYRRAIEMILGKKVIRMQIYSFTLKKALEITE
jgi:ATP-dependent helicase/nuclease subunit A